MSQLKSLSEIFEHRLICIPDYQRGSIRDKQLENIKRLASKTVTKILIMVKQ